MRELLFWMLFPLVLPQALRLRRNAPRFVQAAGPKEGRVGAGPPLRLVGIGDSIIAGVGAATLDLAFVGQTAAALAKALHAEVHWTAQGQSGARVAKVRRLVDRLPETPPDFIVVSVGVNDVTGLTRLRAWKAHLDGLLAALTDHAPQAFVLLAGLPPLRTFPLLPQPLRALIGFRGVTFDYAARRVAARYPQVVFLPLDFEPTPDAFSEDGYHPSEASYRAYGQVAAQWLVDRYRTHHPAASGSVAP